MADLHDKTTVSGDQDAEPPAKRFKATDSKPDSGVENGSKTPDDFEMDAEGSDYTDNGYAGVTWRASESDVGITEYVSKLQGFSGILKQRYSDFLVNEIDEDDKVLRLTNVAEMAEEKDAVEEEVDTSVLPPDCVDYMKKISTSHDYEENILIEVGEDKELRTSVHKAIRGLKLPLESSTEEDEKGKKVIRVQKTKLAFGQSYVPPNRWPGDRPNYCHFLLYKENRDTAHVLNQIASALHVRNSLFSYAGTKDKRAKTVQKVAAYRIPMTKLLKLNKWWRQEIMLGNCSYEKKVLRLGDQNGNRFAIVLRAVDGSDEVMSQAMESLKDHGFLNYFGMQRFGTSATPTHKVGKALLKSNWSEAIDLILLSNPGVHVHSCPWRKVWVETKDPAKTLDAMDRRRSAEKNLLEGLRRFGPKDFVNALDTIPRNIRTMYVHSYQSYIWNTVMSQRVAKHGLVPIVGDLVLTSGLTRHVKGENKSVPTRITADTVEDYSIYDVVLPLPGYDVLYPDNDVKDHYIKLLSEDQLTIEGLKHRVKDYSLPGAYRYILVKPSDVTWDILHYDDVSLPLLLSDVDRVNQVAEPKSVQGGKYKALKLEFSLPPSTYATMAVREILKQDTSSAHQASLNT